MIIGVLGAGVAGLSFARIAGKHFDVEVLEKKTVSGGIARTKMVDGVSYHLVGGHCFNSKFLDVLEFVFSEVLPIENWHKVQRNASIKLQGQEINYPIEYAIKDIFEFDPTLAINITKDFLSCEDNNVYENLEDWFRKKFGNTLSDLYFIPYNRKIWNKDPRLMSPAWVEGKLPIPNKTSFFKGLISKSEDNMPHASFYYPNSNNQNSFIDALAAGLKITYDYTVDTIAYDLSRRKWKINNEKEFDIIVSTLPLNILPSLLLNVPDFVLDASNQLKYNEVTNMLWETRPTDRTWTYIPEGHNLFHRYIHIGNFFKPKRNYTITEAIGKRSYAEMLENGRVDPFLLRPIDFNISEHAYVVFDENYNSATSVVKNYIKELGINTLGRFGEWEYYNMDVCIKKSIDMAKFLLDKYPVAK